MDGIRKIRRPEEDVLREGTDQLLRLYDSSGKFLHVIFRCRRERNLDACLVQSLVEWNLDGPVVSGGYEIQNELLKESIYDHDRSLQTDSGYYGSH